MLGDDEPVPVRLRVAEDRAEGALRELRGDATITPRDDGSVDVELTITNRAAFRSFVLGLADHAEVLAPPEIRAEIIEWLERLVASTGASAAGAKEIGA